MGKNKETDSEELASGPDPWEIMDRLSRSLEVLANRSNEAGPNSQELMQTLTQAMVRISETQLEGSKLIAQETRRATRPSNEVVHNRSVFNRRGELLAGDEPGPHKPKFVCPMFFPWIVEWESSTREEVELANLLAKSGGGTFTIKRIDGSKIPGMNVMVSHDIKGEPSRLIITHDTAFGPQNFRLMPPAADFLRQMLRQCDQPIPKEMALILTDEEEEALIEANEISVSQ